MYKLFKILRMSAVALALTVSFSTAESFWDKAKSAVTDTATKVADTATDAYDDVSGDNKTSKAEDRQTINNNAEKSLARLFKESAEAIELYEKAAGYAVFDSREFAFFIKTGFGSGVAVNKENDSRTYMKMGSGGLNIGGGVKYVQVIFLFPTQTSFNEFITDGWNAEGDASAVGGDDSAQIGVTLANGTKVYELVDTGIMAKMSISGTKYWKDSDLN